MQDSFSVMQCRSICPVLLLPLLHVLFISLFDSLFLLQNISTASLRYRQPISLFLLFTLCLSSSHLLFPLLTFVFTSQSHDSCCYCLSCFLPTLFNRPLAFFCHCYSLSSLFLLAVCTRVLVCGGCECGDLRGWSEHSRVPTNLQVTRLHVTLPVTCTITVVIQGWSQLFQIGKAIVMMEEQCIIMC